MPETLATTTTLDPLIAVIRDAPRCPRFDDLTAVDRCDGLQGCDRCLELAAAAVREALHLALNRPSLTERQHQVYAFLADRIRQQGYAPTLGEIAAHFDLRSISTVHEYLGELVKKGYIARRPNEERGLTVLG